MYARVVRNVFVVSAALRRSCHPSGTSRYYLTHHSPLWATANTLTPAMKTTATKKTSNSYVCSCATEYSRASDLRRPRLNGAYLQSGGGGRRGGCCRCGPSPLTLVFLRGHAHSAGLFQLGDAKRVRIPCRVRSIAGRVWRFYICPEPAETTELESKQLRRFRFQSGCGTHGILTQDFRPPLPHK